MMLSSRLIVYKTFLAASLLSIQEKARQKEKTPFKDKIGTQVFSSAISVYDRPQFSEASFYHLLMTRAWR